MPADAPSPAGLPREVVEAARTASIREAMGHSCMDKQCQCDGGLTCDFCLPRVLEPGLLAAVSHPSFAPWFLRELAKREPSGPHQIEKFRGQSPSPWFHGDTAVPPSFGVHGPIEMQQTFETRDQARLVAHCLNALAPGGPKEGTK